jgi:precorrin isomerase
MSLPDAPGFYPQPNEWTCGPFALKHALIALGKFVDATELAAAAKTHWWSGTDEIRLARAAREHECDLVLERRRDPEEARKLLVRFLKEQVPVLLCVEEWTHWITVVGHEDRRFIMIDSTDEPVMSVATWPQIRNKWRYHDFEYDKVQPPVLYDLMAVIPRSRSALKADFSVERVKHLRRPENHHLALHWNEYVEDLTAICKPSMRIIDGLSMAEFLRRHQEMLVTRVIYWHGDVARDDIMRVLRNLRFVSETYGLVIPASAARRALADLAIVVTLWACAARGVDEMYGLGGAIARDVQRAEREEKKATRKRIISRTKRNARAKKVRRKAKAASTAKRGAVGKTRASKITRKRSRRPAA